MIFMCECVCHKPYEYSEPCAACASGPCSRCLDLDAIHAMYGEPKMGNNCAAMSPVVPDSVMIAAIAAHEKRPSADGTVWYFLNSGGAHRA